ncbi:MAG: hypothetical protein ACPG5B_07800 [Chitinophagales bacterium]
MKAILYQEEQFYPKHYLAGFALFIGLAIYFFIKQYIFNTLNASEMPMIAVVASIFILIVGFVYLLKTHFSVKITNKNLKIKYGALHDQKVKIKLTDIEEYDIVHISFLAQLSGGNVQFNTRSHAFGILNNKVLSLKLKNGERWIVGVKNADKLRQTLNSLSL